MSEPTKCESLNLSEESKPERFFVPCLSVSPTVFVLHDEAKLLKVETIYINTMRRMKYEKYLEGNVSTCVFKLSGYSE